METKANYVLIGAATLIGAAVFMVYWAEGWRNFDLQTDNGTLTPKGEVFRDSMEFAKR